MKQLVHVRGKIKLFFEPEISELGSPPVCQRTTIDVLAHLVWEFSLFFPFFQCLRFAPPRHQPLSFQLVESAWGS